MADRWRQSLANVPRDGTPILMVTDRWEYPFVAHYGHVGRYTTSPKMWIGHCFGAVEDRDILAWRPLPRFGGARNG